MWPNLAVSGGNFQDHPATETQEFSTVSDRIEKALGHAMLCYLTLKPPKISTFLDNPGQKAVEEFFDQVQTQWVREGFKKNYILGGFNVR